LSKLLKLKEWLTVPDAARHLSILFGEAVLEADVLRLGLDGHLQLSAQFVNHASAQCGKVVPLADVKRREFPTLDGKGVVQSIDHGIYLGEGRVFSYNPVICSIEGIWDLTMLGAENLDVEHKYQFMTGGPAVELATLEGPLVNRPDGSWARIMAHFSKNEHFNKKNLKSPNSHPDNYYPAGGLPDDAVLVVRTSSLQRLETLTSEPKATTQRPVARRERTTLLVIMAALAKLARIDVTKPSSAAVAVEGETIRMGARVAARTIEEHLRRIPEALDNKSEN
jgi:hypothetical protein